MKKLNNEQGYALLTVVLLIAFIMSISTVFISNIVSHAKQEEVVDQNNLAITAAEMGVDYYTSALLNAYYENKDNLIEFAEENASNEDVQEKLFWRLEEVFGNEYFKGNYLQRVEFLEGYSYELKSELDFDTSEPNQFVVQGDVIGTSKDGNTKELTFTQKFNIPNFSETANQSSGSVEGEKDIFEIPESIINICPENVKNLTIDKNCKTNILSTSNQGNNLTVFDEAIVYVKNKIVAKNNFKINNNSKIYVNGKVKVQNKFQISNSELHIFGDFEAGPGGGQASPTLKDGAKVCVRGELKTSGGAHFNNIYDTSKLYVQNKTDPKVWRENCSLSNTELDLSDLDWTNWQVDVEYN